MNLTELPIDLKKQIENEKIDFSLKAKRNYPRSKSLTGLLFGLVWSGFISIFVIVFFGPLFKNEEVHFKSNGEDVTASLEDLSELLVPGLIIGLFVIIGIVIIVYSFISLFQKGGHFVGTETRMIHYRNGKTIITDWEQFNGNVKINAKNNFGDLEYELRTGKMEKRKNAEDKFIPNIIYISGIENVYEIEKNAESELKKMTLLRSM